MKSEIKIPFYLIARHILRGNKWTLGLIIFLISIAYVNLVFISSLFGGIIKLTNNQIIDTYSGNLSITPPAGADYVDNSSAVMSKVKTTANVASASAHVFVPGTLKYKNIKGSWQIVAIDPNNEKQVTTVSQKMYSGSYLSADDASGIIIGRQISGGKDIELNAFSFKDAQVGDKVTLTLGAATKEFTIRGIVYTKYLPTDQRAFITTAALERLAPGQFNNKASEIIVKTHGVDQESGVIKSLKAQGLTETFYTWEDVSGLMKSVTSSFFSINALLTFVGVVITAVTIFIVIYIDITNKRQQIGILRAIGIKPYLIDGMYILQAAVYSTLGVTLGLLLFFGAVVPYFRAYPFVLPLGDATLSINSLDLWLRAELVIFTAIISALIPSIYITRMKILTAIWGK